MNWSGWIVVALVTVNAGWMTFDGARALIVGDYVTPKTGQYAGQLGPWSGVVKAVGIEPRSVGMKSIFLLYGLAAVAVAVCFTLGMSFAWRGLLVIAILGLWYLPFGTLINGIAIVLLLLPPLRSPASGVVPRSDKTAESLAGQRFPSERREYTDEVTGARITMLTTGPAKDNKIYQTHPNWTADGKWIVFTSDRSGSVQFFAVNEDTGEIVQLTDDETPGGHPFLDRTENRMYYQRGRDFVDLDLDPILTGSSPRPGRRFWQLPDGANVSGTFAVDADGGTLYVGLEIAGEPTRWRIDAVDMRTSTSRTVIDVDFKVGHVQANPLRSGVIMYCHETGGDAEQRMWLVNADGSDNRPFYRETYDEWVTHETWWGGDRAIFTIWPKSEEMLKKPHGIVSIGLDEGDVVVHNQHRFWHVGGSSDQRWAVGDTFAGELFLIDVATGARRLLTQGHRPQGADVHPHPSISPDNRRVLFCSQRNGSWDIFTVDVPR